MWGFALVAVRASCIPEAWAYVTLQLQGREGL